MLNLEFMISSKNLLFMCIFLLFKVTYKLTGQVFSQNLSLLFFGILR